MEDTPIKQWLSQLADKTPTPGGGAAAALFAATSAALLGMVSNYTIGGKWTDREARMKQLVDEAETLRARALEIAQEDAVAFSAVGTAYGLPRTTDDEKEQRRTAVQAALVGAAVPPSDVVAVAQTLVAIAEELAEAGNPNVISDVAVAASGISAALESAIVNIEINAALIRDEDKKKELAQLVSDASGAMEAAKATVQRVRQAISS